MHFADGILSDYLMEMTMQNRFRTCVTMMCTLALAFSVTACDSKKKAESEGAKAKKEKETDKAKEEKAKKEKKEKKKEKKVEKTDYDLGEATDEWKGFAITAPKGFEIMKDLGGAARLTKDGMDTLDMALEPGHTDLAKLKKNSKIGADKNDKMKLDFKVDKEDHMVWTSTYGDQDPSWNFEKHMEVAGKKFTCRNNHQMGLSSEKMVEQSLEICKSLHKADAEGKKEGKEEKKDEEKKDEEK